MAQDGSIEFGVDLCRFSSKTMNILKLESMLLWYNDLVLDIANIYLDFVCEKNHEKSPLLLLSELTIQIGIVKFLNELF